MEQMNEYLGIVIYTDGGARPNPGNTGWGAHGYLYTTKLDKKGTGLQKYITSTTGYQSIGKNNGVIPVTPIEYFDFFGTCEYGTTNNSAEIDALYHSLHAIKEYNIRDLQIYTDSEYLRRGLNEWISHWKRSQWLRSDNIPISNSEHWKRLDALIEDIRAKNINLKIDWIKAHSDEFGNTIADKLATLGVIYASQCVSRTDLKISPATGYWKSEVDRHPFISFKRMYFNSSKQYNIPGHYYITEPGCDDLVIGKRTPETSYSVVRLKNPDPIIETIREKQCDVSNDYNSVIMLLLDRVYHPDIHPYLKEHGQYALCQASRYNTSLNFIDDKPITIERNPAGLSLRAIESFGLLDELLERYTLHQKNQLDYRHLNSLFQVHDITDKFYRRNEPAKGKKTTNGYTLLPEYNVGYRDTTITVNVKYKQETREINLPIVLGLDLPSRNGLKKLESTGPTVCIITWCESEGSYRYACVIETDDGLGIWSNFYADRIFITDTV